MDAQLTRRWTLSCQSILHSARHPLQRPAKLSAAAIDHAAHPGRGFRQADEAASLIRHVNDSNCRVNATTS